MTSHNAPVESRHRAYWVSVIFAALAVVLATQPLKFTSPVAQPLIVSADVTDTTPQRHPMPQPHYLWRGFDFSCNECHRQNPVPTTAGRGIVKHMGIHLAHGINTRCLNCHHPANREVFVDDYGKEIPWSEPQLVCAKCHGPVFRDWQHGSHGRINGYWDTSRGEQVRLKCTACHDPHHPPFPPLASAPGPHTLRVHPDHRAAHAEVRNPLRVKDLIPSSSAAGDSHGNNEHE